MFSAKNLLRYYAWRLVKFVPLLGMVLLFSMYVLPFAGSGPIWADYETKVMQPCNAYWWTVLAQVNNIYPTTGFDDKCMPWGWFIPALTQVSLCLPIFAFIYTRCIPRQGGSFGRQVLARAIFATLVTLFLVMNAIVTYYYDLGALPVRILPVSETGNDPNQLNTLDFQFYDKVFMQGYYHMGSYLIGFCLAISYRRFAYETETHEKAKTERSSLAAARVSHASRLYTLIAANGCFRYALYTIGVASILGACLWVYPFMSDAGGQSRLHAALYALFANLLFLGGFATILMPALIGKASLFRYIFQAGMFLALSNLSAAMSLIGPMICLWYYLSSGHTLDIGWYTTQYYYDSNCVFTFLISLMLATISEKPFYSLVTIKTDTEDAEKDDKNSIIEFRRDHTKGSSVAMLSSYRQVDAEAEAHRLGSALPEQEQVLLKGSQSANLGKKGYEDSMDGQRLTTADNSGMGDRSTRMHTQAYPREESKGRITRLSKFDDSGERSR